MRIFRYNEIFFLKTLFQARNEVITVINVLNQDNS